MKTTKNRTNRIDWKDTANLVCAHLVNHGLHGDTIAVATGLSRCQVYYRAKCLGLHLRDYRNGKGPIAVNLLRKFCVRKMTSEERQSLKLDVWPIMGRRLQERKNGVGDDEKGNRK